MYMYVLYSHCDVSIFVSQDVTKGARNKILISIKKLHKRQETLAEIDQVSDCGHVNYTCSLVCVIVLATCHVVCYNDYCLCFGVHCTCIY